MSIGTNRHPPSAQPPRGTVFTTFNHRGTRVEGRKGPREVRWTWSATVGERKLSCDHLADVLTEIDKYHRAETLKGASHAY